MLRTLVLAALMWSGFIPPAVALSPGTDVLIPAAARTGPWRTDLYLFNPGESEVDVTVYWLVRDQFNPDPESWTTKLAPGETRVLGDVILSTFGRKRGTGAFRVTASNKIVATCRIYASDGGATYGQAFEGVPSPHATVAGTTTHVIGISANDGFRTNLYAVALAEGATVEVALHDPDGQLLASTTLVLGEYQPSLAPITEVVGVEDVDHGTLFVRVADGRAVVGASKIDNFSADPTTLSSWVPGIGDPIAAGSYYGVVAGPQGGSSGGMAIRVNGSGEVVGLEFSYPTGRCPVLFSAGQDLSESPLPLTDLETGHTFGSSYPGGGDMSWSLQLELQSDGPTLAGTLAATGSGWTGDLDACNGSHAATSVAMGAWQP